MGINIFDANAGGVAAVIVSANINAIKPFICHSPYIYYRQIVNG